MRKIAKPPENREQAASPTLGQKMGDKLRELKRFFSREPQDPIAQSSRKLMRQGRYEEAAAIFIKEGRIAEAAGVFEAAAKIKHVGFEYDSDFHRFKEFYIKAAELYERAGILSKAAACYELAGDFFNAGFVFAAMGDDESAARLARRCERAAHSLLFSRERRPERLREAAELYEKIGLIQEAARVDLEADQIEKKIKK